MSEKEKDVIQLVRDAVTEVREEVERLIGDIPIMLESETDLNKIKKILSGQMKEHLDWREVEDRVDDAANKIKELDEEKSSLEAESESLVSFDPQNARERRIAEHLMELLRKQDYRKMEAIIENYDIL